MKISERGLNLIKEFEGLRLEPYQDIVGVWTVGYGSTGRHVVPGRAITEARAEQLLLEDLVRFEDCVNKMVVVPMGQSQFDALVSFAFNLGCGNLASSTLLKKLNAGDYAGAAEQFPRWNRAGGKVVAGLTRRREAEKALFMRA